MILPSRNEEEKYLREAEKMNAGDWIQHSINTAKYAETISGYHSKLNGESAYILGLLHDIGRREGKTYIRHTIVGYNFLVNKGFPDAARACITHAFHYNYVNAVYSKLDYNEFECSFVNNFLRDLKMDEYDYQIQLCDC